MLVDRDLLLDDVLVQHLIVELEGVLIDEVVVEALALLGLDDDTLVELHVDLAAHTGSLMLLSEDLFLLEGVVLVVSQTTCRGIELFDSTVVQMFHLDVERLFVNSVPLLFELALQLLELLLNIVCLLLQVLVEVLGTATINGGSIFVCLVNRALIVVVEVVVRGK